jgi:hypothetical protein
MDDKPRLRHKVVVTTALLLLTIIALVLVKWEAAGEALVLALLALSYLIVLTAQRLSARRNAPERRGVEKPGPQPGRSVE